MRFDSNLDYLCQIMSSKVPAANHSETAPSIYIPPLNIGNGLRKTTYLPHNVSMGNLHAATASQNIDFLKQKSFYRCYISKHNPKEGKSQHLRTLQSPSFLKNEQDSPQQVGAKNTSSRDLRKSFPSFLGSPQAMDGMSRDRYFKRTNPILPTANRNKINQGTQPSAANQADPNPENDKPTPLKELLKKKEAQIEALSVELKQIRSEKDRLTERVTQYAEKMGELEVSNLQLQQENTELEEQLRRNRSSISDELAEETRLETQIKAREEKINQLENSLRYTEIENCMLKKLKQQCVEQKELITRLERSKQLLTSKLKKMYVESQSQKSMKASFTSEYSEISFNFSQEEEDKYRADTETETTQGTPLRVRGREMGRPSVLQQRAKICSSKR